MILESEKLENYLEKSELIDYDNALIVKKCLEIQAEVKDDVTMIKKTFEFVRDEIKHSADFNITELTLKASDVLIKGHGICHAKSVLLAAMLRYFNFPAGFCYQKLCSDDDKDIKLLHGLNAVYLKDYNKWIRLDARGNKPGVDAQFSIDEEKIAWPINKENGEEDYRTIYAEPNEKLVHYMTISKCRSELWKHLMITDNDSLGNNFSLI